MCISDNVTFSNIIWTSKTVYWQKLYITFHTLILICFIFYSKMSLFVTKNGVWCQLKRKFLELWVSFSSTLYLVSEWKSFTDIEVVNKNVFIYLKIILIPYNLRCLIRFFVVRKNFHKWPEKVLYLTNETFAQLILFIFRSYKFSILFKKKSI